MPVDTINRALGTELEPGDVHLAERAHRHIATDHPGDYPVCLAALSKAIAAPSFVGQDPKHGRNFVLVKRIGLSDGRAVLVAIGLEPNKSGNYNIRTSYLIPHRTIEARRAAGRLKIAISR